jgi:hypothetical protein
MGVMNEIQEQLGLKGKLSSTKGKNDVEKLFKTKSCGMFESQIIPNDYVTVLNCSLIKRDSL